MRKPSRVMGVADLFLLSNIPLIFDILNINKSLMTVPYIFAVVYFIILNIVPSGEKNSNGRLRIMYNGRELALIFMYGFAANIISLLIVVNTVGLSAGNIVLFSVITLAAGAVVMLNGVLRMFFTSKRLRIVLRVMIIMLWWLPVVNIIIIHKACRTVYNEYIFDTDKLELDNARAENEVCKTKYPILMVHGVFFRDLKFMNYWGRVPAELVRNGAVIFYGGQHSAASVARCGEELKNKIEEIIRTTGCEKVNIIAHSKGGLDSRYAISCLGMDKYVASLTTVNTPHRGCEYADFILEHAPFGFKNFLAEKYNSALRVFGEANPDFISAVTELTARSCAELNEIALDMPGVYYRSIGSRMKKSSSAAFPLNICYNIVKMFYKGDNDGMVDVESMKWGTDHIFFEPKTKRGLSHGDVIDLMREDIPGFDIREEYVKLAADLKMRGF